MGLLYVYFLATNIARIKQCYRLCRVNKSPKPCNMVLTPDTSGGWREAHASVREYVERPARPAVDAAYLHQVCSPQITLPKGLSPSWITYGLPACFDGVHRLSGVPHSAEDLPRFDALFNSHYVSP